MLDRDRSRQQQRNVAAKRARDARYRQNQRDGIAVAPTPFNATIVDALVRWHFLRPDEEHSPREIGRAMFKALEQAAALNELNELLKYLRGASR
jgi:hypothetical protein